MTPSRLGAILVLTVVPLYLIVGIVFDGLNLPTTLGAALVVGVLCWIPTGLWVLVRTAFGR